ncbi:DUF4192 domain-containing protein [Nonomuraea sp. FMUSA5-5]|uniref:DUF4192 domain-containing protein n=1 Tax=Nonomuraea composti TaxID=2720023 RepID=A0ABX1B194_9ACTN|nr:DUF4192 domain-containing protein [Nonomuraea sp. FMUSA5-5]NJP91613.1 DUF4192 domain-containing protein [Nonomuraea sp. FMUSA5-5]
MTETVCLSQPADYLAIVPYLLGFHPAMSLVILAFDDQTLVSGIRHDLPHADDEATDIVALSLKILARQEIRQIAVIGYGPADVVTPMLDRMREAVAPTDILLLKLLRCEGDRYWSSPDADPPEGTPYDITTSQAAAAAVVAGLAALPARRAFATRLQPVDGPDRDAVRTATRAARERAASLLATSTTPRYWYEEGLRAVHAAFAHQGAGEPLTPEEVAWLSVLLTSIVVRDVAITTTRAYPASDHIALWTEMVRRAEPGYVAAPATLLAVAAYGCGAGPLARIAVDRALADSRDYTMALLVDCALNNGVPPSAIHEMHAAVTAEVLQAQLELSPEAALPKLPIPPEGR